jgi:guanosine-3',5'-bis(diphosphate) 3'-pyrophosphohydrolase
MADDKTNIVFDDERPQKSDTLKTLQQLQDTVATYLAGDVSVVEKAYNFSKKAHEGQLRRSGEPYIFHPLSVAGILAELRLDLASIVTGLLHDTVEDTGVTLETIEAEFGKDVAMLVDGVTKISKINFRNTHEKQGENIRKMIVAMGKDIRVILVKLADRLHNMRTLNHMPYDKQAGIAQETLDIYAPLANRLGISAWKIELEDLSLRYLRPDIYYDLVQKVSKKKREREKYIEQVVQILRGEMDKVGIPCEIQGRPKHFYSIYRKMQTRNMDYDQVHDVLAFRILVDSVARCYEALGVVHSAYKPIPGRFKDYVALAKSNNYQSLHTTVIGPDGERIEIQIRTEEMHLVAERGIAAHWKYKESGVRDTNSEKKFNWLRELVSWHQQVRDSNEFLENVKTDLFESEIYVFTPSGEVKELPDGATALDFAYAVHTDVGNKTTAAKINGRIVPLKHRLKNGDTLEIITSPNQTPSKDWIKFCITTRAQTKIRAFVRNEERKRSHDLGRELVEKEFRKFGLNFERQLKGAEFDKYLKSVGAGNLDELLILVGYGKILPLRLIEGFAPAGTITKPEQKPDSFLGKVIKNATERVRKSRSVIEVDGMSDVLVRYARCCNPIPGDPIVGAISRGRGVTIHQASCQKLYEVDNERRVDVKWTETSEAITKTKIRVLVQDAQGMLRQMSDCFTTHGVNIENAQLRTTKDKKGICLFDVTVKGRKQLSLVIQDLQKIKGVLSVERVNHA